MGILEDLEKELKLVEGWKSEAKSLHNERSQYQDITEELSQQELEEWRKKHRESVKKEKALEKEKPVEKTQTDAELWERLEELEVREALEEQWAQQQDDEDEDLSDDDDDCDDDDDDDDDEDDEDYSHDEDDGYDEPVNNCQRQQQFYRRVSFADDKHCETPTTQLITFSHSATESEPRSELFTADGDSSPMTIMQPKHPGDVGPRTASVVAASNTAPSPKSILKSHDGYNPADFVHREEPSATAVGDNVPFVNPVQSTVQERPFSNVVVDPPT